MGAVIFGLGMASALMLQRQKPTGIRRLILRLVLGDAAVNDDADGVVTCVGEAIIGSQMLRSTPRFCRRQRVHPSEC